GYVQVKKFSFPLARVLDLRRTQVRIEETKLERLHAELRAIDSRLASILQAREECGKALIAAGSVTGEELIALGHYRKAAASEAAGLAQSAAAARQRISEQMQVLVRRRRDAKLLEHLHDTRFEAWSKELGQEIDREASELHLFKLQTR